jgi:outer membrane protein OmpA-like peptidoglycan-associated protein
LLSQRRADAVVNYLVEKGIDKKRLSAKGYGQSKPVDSNDTAEGRALNRRTEFEIIEN